MKLLIFPFVALASALRNQQTVLQESHHQRQPVNIAIIGAGAAGSSTAYHLSKFANPLTPINITIFERNRFIGGRSTTVSAYDSSSLPVELGASIFVQINKILASAVLDFNLSTSSISEARRTKAIPGPSLAIWDGQKILITQNGGYWDYVSTPRGKQHAKTGLKSHMSSTSLLSLSLSLRTR